MPNGLGQVKLAVGHVDLSQIFCYILYMQMENIHDSGSEVS